MDWYDVTLQFNQKTYPHEGSLLSLPAEWQRELAALWRLEADVNNGAYLQFLSNQGRESYVYASQALKKIKANKMAKIIDECQSLVDSHFNSEGASQEELRALMPNASWGTADSPPKEPGSTLPDSVVERLYDLSYQFMDYPDDLPILGAKYYRPILKEQGIDVEAASTRSRLKQNLSFLGLDLSPYAPTVLWLLGWGGLALGAQCFRAGLEGQALLGLIVGVGSLYLKRKISDHAG